jgi:phosphatidylcholine synthase
MHILAAWLVHVYTASGAVLAFLAALDIFQYQYRRAFLWLALQIVVDATDGVLARWVRVDKHTPTFRGAHLDDIVDYAAYVFVPALFIWRAVLVPADWTLVVCSAILLASAYGFSRADAKTEDHFFTGFPSYWNIVAFYLLLAGWPQEVNGWILLVLVALVFVPVRYVYPSRTAILRRTTVALGIVWAVLMLWMLWLMPAVPRALFWVSLTFPIYYAALSLILTLAPRRDAPYTR